MTDIASHSCKYDEGINHTILAQATNKNFLDLPVSP